jgi:hypothetical protein
METPLDGSGLKSQRHIEKKHKKAMWELRQNCRQFPIASFQNKEGFPETLRVGQAPASDSSVELVHS